MKLQSQVCSPEQGKKLLELGITATALFHHIRYDNYPLVIIPANYYDEDVIDFRLYESMGVIHEEYPAFTVAELGVMLPHPGSLNEMGFWLHNSEYDSSEIALNWFLVFEIPGSEDESGFRKVLDGNTEAEARAAALIYLLENNHITASEVNTRLKND